MLLILQNSNLYFKCIYLLALTYIISMEDHCRGPKGVKRIVSEILQKVVPCCDHANHLFRIHGPSKFLE